MRRRRLLGVLLIWIVPLVIYLALVYGGTAMTVSLLQDRQLLAAAQESKRLQDAGVDLCGLPQWMCGADLPEGAPHVRAGEVRGWWAGGVWTPETAYIALNGDLVVARPQLAAGARSIRDVVTWFGTLTAGVGAAMWLLLGPVLYRRRLRRLRRALRQLTQSQGAAVDPGSDAMADALRETAGRLHTTQQALLRAERLATLGYFAGGVAHQIGNPLSAARQYVEVLQTRVKDRESGAVVERVRNLLDRIDRAVEGLMRFAQPDRLERRRITVATFVEERRRDLARLLPEDIVWDEEISEGLAVVTDVLALEQILINVLRNAVEAQGDRPWVGVRAFVADDRVILEIRDAGPGFPEGFDPDTPLMSGKASGTGLGLPLAVRLAELLGGRLEVRNGDSGGCVRLILPHLEPGTEPHRIGSNES